MVSSVITVFHEKEVTILGFFYETEAVLSLSKIQGISGNPSMDSNFLKYINFSIKIEENM